MASQDWVDKDFYAILGIAKDASDADIKKAYRKLARQYHPDTNAGDAAAEKKFKDISEAYSVLSSPEDRQQYDAIRAMGGARFAPGAGGRGTPGGNGGFEDLFGGLFGGGPGARQPAGGGLPPEFADLFGGGFGGGQTGFQRTPQKGSDRTATTSISFAGSIHGTTVSLRESNGNVIDVKIPAGIKDGQKVRQRGKGNAGPAGNGDLIITVSVKPHEFFQRDGADLFCRVPISMVTAALAGEITVPVIDGSQTQVRVPAGTQTAKQFRIKGKGMPVLRSRDVGDLYIQVFVETPQNLSKRQRELLQEFDQSASDENHPESAGFFSKVKDFFDGLGGTART